MLTRSYLNAHLRSCTFVATPSLAACIPTCIPSAARSNLTTLSVIHMCNSHAHADPPIPALVRSATRHVSRNQFHVAPNSPTNSPEPAEASEYRAKVCATRSAVQCSALSSVAYPGYLRSKFNTRCNQNARRSAQKHDQTELQKGSTQRANQAKPT